MDKENQCLISDLIVLAKADGVVTPSEMEFIKAIALQLEITDEELQLLFINPLPSTVQKSELDRITHFYKLMLLMNIDQETHEKEILMIRRLGLKMGIRPGVFDQMLSKMNSYENNVIPSKEIMKIFHTYYN